MIQIHESSNWIAQYYFELVLLCLIVAALSLSVFGAATSFIIEKKRFVKYSKVVLPISFCVLIISGYALFAFSAQGPRYSGSGIYEIDKLHTKESGKQIAIVNDSKSDVELELTNPDKNDYSKGDKIRVNIESNNSKAKGTHNLSRLMSLDRKGIFQTTYDTEKVSSDDSDIDKLLQALKDIDNDKDK